jgi:pyruvate carboxylase
MQAATLLKAVEQDVDVIDVCLSSMSGLTSQVNWNSMVAILQGHERERPYDLDSLNEYANYWEDVREFYYPFESGLLAGTAEVYEHEIPGGQYSNLRPQAVALGLGERFETIKKNYAVVNRMFGDIVKVTPSSKVVGDMALFMTANGLNEEDVMAEGDTLAFPESVVDLFSGKLGKTGGGFPEKLSAMVLKGRKPLSEAPGASLPAVDFDAGFSEFKAQFDDTLSIKDYLSYLMYPDVFNDYYKHKERYGEVDYLPTPAFFYGLRPGEETLVKLQRGKTISIRLVYRSKPDENGNCKVAFELNGQARSVQIRDETAAPKAEVHRKATEANELGAPLMGRLASVLVKAGDAVEKDTPLFVIEAMKMETTITAPKDGEIKSVELSAGTLVDQGDLVIEFA